jgi:vacuolar-type H+-ATPase subunit E/Vma4
MTAMAPALSDPLAPVREALAERARSEAERTLRQADADGAAIRGRAQEEVERILAAARAQGEEDARALIVAESARARRRARAVVLGAQRAAYEDMRAGVREAVRDLRNDPAYRAWRDRLVERARRTLGEDARMSEHPDGGVSAQAGARRVEYTLAGLAGQVVEGLGHELDGLWS